MSRIFATQSLSAEMRQYCLVTANYWAFTLTDGALRMLVVLHFHQLGYSPLELALLFVFYEFFGVVTNLVGGWLGALIGLNKTMNLGLALQIAALSMLLVPESWLSVAWVMAAQALSGIAKDLNKMSAKSAIKTLLPDEAQGTLYKWVARLTGSKNAFKGLGFFLGGLLLAGLGFSGAILAMTSMLLLVWLYSLVALQHDLGRAKNKPKFRELFSKSPAINALSAARLCLFAARDVWFVIALPVYLASELGWDHWAVGSLLALWVIAYGGVQTIAPKLTGIRSQHPPDGRAAMLWAGVLIIAPGSMVLLLISGVSPALSLLLGLTLFCVLFAINSSLHSYLIVSYAAKDGVSLDVGFYYMANALGRLLGTVLSGWLYQLYGLEMCLWVACGLILATALLSWFLPHRSRTD